VFAASVPVQSACDMKEKVAVLHKLSRGEYSNGVILDGR